MGSVLIRVLLSIICTNAILGYAVLRCRRMNITTGTAALGQPQQSASLIMAWEEQGGHCLVSASQWAS